MLNALAYFKDIFTLCSFGFGVHLYLKSFYQLNVFQIGSWWVKNYSSVDYGGPLLIGLFFGLLFSYGAYAVAIHATYVSILGDTKTYLFIGDGEGRPSFVDPENMDAPAFTADFRLAHNETFKNIYARVPFVFEKGTTRRGAVKSSQTLRRILPPVLLGLALTMVLWGVLHSAAYPAYVGIHFEGASYELSAKEMFAQQIGLVGLSEKKMVFLGLAFLMLGSGTALLSGKDKYSPPAIDISEKIYPGAEVKGRPLFAFVVYANDAPGDSGPKIDTGRRRSCYEFNVGLPTPVYVSFHFLKDDYPGLFETIEQAIENKQTIDFVITDELALEPVGEYWQGDMELEL